jgi:hypothetical protein
LNDFPEVIVSNVAIVGAAGNSGNAFELFGNSSTGHLSVRLATTNPVQWKSYNKLTAIHPAANNPIKGQQSQSGAISAS